MKRARSALEEGEEQELNLVELFDDTEKIKAESRARREAILSKHKQSIPVSHIDTKLSTSSDIPIRVSINIKQKNEEKVVQKEDSSKVGIRQNSHVLDTVTSTTTASTSSSSSSSSSSLSSSSSSSSCMFDIFGTNEDMEEQEQGDQRDNGSKKISPVFENISRINNVTKGAIGAIDNADDSEGYYRLRVGELIGDRYLVLGTRGRGVFSSVLFCKDTMAIADANLSLDNQSSLSAEKDESTIRGIADGEVITSAAKLTVGETGALVKRHTALATGSSVHVAIKVIRSNDTMRRACLKEIEILRELNTADPTGRYHCVRLLHQFEHAGHNCLVFEPLAMNLKEVQDKFGTGVGLSVRGVQEFARQLLLSLALLDKLKIIHADIKPHNILSSESYRTIKLADFGSALRTSDETDLTPTPYLQSRFYRAPEVILGCKITSAIDMWSVACVLYELFTGHPLFPGINNNDMLYKMQSTVGRISQKLVKKHLQHSTVMGLETHFEDTSVSGSGPSFKRRVKDPVTGLPGIKLLDFTFVKATDEIKKRLDSARADGDDKKTVHDLGSLLVCMLNPDPGKRITVHDALKNVFITSRGVNHK